MKLPKNTSINKYAIELIEGKWLLYGLIYAFNLVELKTLKAYIITLLKTGFIWSFKSPTDISILFNKKLNGSFCLYIDYWGLINLTIKNSYPVLLICKVLDCLGQAKQFT